MRQSIKNVIEDGFEVHNSEGGYLRKIDSGNYLHQTYYRSSQYFDTAEAAINSFIEESNKSE